jgi:hypothetical protein
MAVYLVDIPKDFRIDLNSFAKLPDALQTIRDNSDYDGDDFYDNDGDRINRAKQDAYKKGFISKRTCDYLNRQINNIRNGTTFYEDAWSGNSFGAFEALLELFEKKKFVLMGL